MEEKEFKREEPNIQKDILEKEKTAAQEAQLEQALDTLRRFLLKLAEQAGESTDYAEELWERIAASGGLLRELAYYHDYGDFLCEYKVSGYTVADILVWQVDHFKAYLDRPMEMNRYHRERLLLVTFDIMSRMERDPEPYVSKMRGETGTDYVGKY